MTNSCALCGGEQAELVALSEMNAEFLRERRTEGNLEEALTLARIAWNTFPAIRLDSTSKLLVSELLKSLQSEVAKTLTPIDGLGKSLLALSDKMSQLSDRLPESIRTEFKEANDKVAEQGRQIVDATLKAEDATRTEIRELGDTINELIHKPIQRGTVAEKTLAEVWQEAFVKDHVERVGGAGKPDIIVTPHIGNNGFRLGEPIVIERKAGKQKYSGQHLEQTVDHAKKTGSRWAVLVYDSEENLLDLQRPIYVTFEEGVAVMVTDVASAGWKTARQVIEIFQILFPRVDTPVKIDLQLVQRAVADLQKTNEYIVRLRRHASSAADSCEKIGEEIEGLENCIEAHKQKLRDLISKQTAPVQAAYAP